jgi:hypothetical protein
MLGTMTTMKMTTTMTTSRKRNRRRRVKKLASRPRLSRALISHN